MARKLFPVPIQPIIEHEAFVALPAAGAGILFRLIANFWESGCQPRPIADHDLRAIGRAHLATWKEHKAAIMRVFDDVAPELAAYHRDRTQKRSILKIVASRGAAVRDSQRAAARIAASASPPSTVRDPSQYGLAPRQSSAKAARVPDTTPIALDGAPKPVARPLRADTFKPR